MKKRTTTHLPHLCANSRPQKLNIGSEKLPPLVYLFRRKPLKWSAFSSKLSVLIGLILGSHCLFAQGELAGQSASFLPNFIQVVILSLLVLVAYLFFRERSKAIRMKQQLEVLSAENTRLAQANQDLLHFNAEVMHDLKSPLRTMTSFTNLFLRRFSAQLTTEGSEYLNYIQDAGRRLQLMIDNTAQFKETAIISPADWADASTVLKETLANLHFDIEQQQADIVVDYQQFPRLPILAGQLMQVFQNLVCNSLKFVRPHEQPQIRISCTTDCHWHTFSVVDNGIGIPENKFKQIFQRFTRLHTDQNDYEGTGLGLTTCKNILSRYGGDIWLDSQPGIGTTFYFKLPVSLNETPIKNEKNYSSVFLKSLNKMLFSKVSKAAVL